jgi:hypothetical protein
VFLLNTNVVSERRKAGDGRADADVVAFLAGCDAAQFLSLQHHDHEARTRHLLMERRGAL